MSFRIRALPAAPFAPLFALSDDALRAHRAVRCVVDQVPGFPCRVSLRDAALGETVLLVHYEHQPADTPYRAAHAIYVREGAVEARPEIDEIPDVLRARLLSVRAFDAADMLDNAKPGCFAARVDRR